MHFKFILLSFEGIVFLFQSDVFLLHLLNYVQICKVLIAQYNFCLRGMAGNHAIPIVYNAVRGSSIFFRILIESVPCEIFRRLRAGLRSLSFLMHTLNFG